MREEIENDAGGHAQFLAQQKGFVEVIEVFLVCNNDQFINTAFFQQRTNILWSDDSDQLQAPVQMGFNSLSEIAARQARFRRRQHDEHRVHCVFSVSTAGRGMK